MPLDYKYTKENHPSPTHAKHKFLVIFLTVLLLTGLPYGLFFLHTRNSDEQLLTGQYEDALKTLHYWKMLPFVSGRVYERIGTAELLLHGQKEADPYFLQAEKKIFSSPVDFWQDILKIFWTHARYDEGLFYTEHLQKAIHGVSVLRFYKAGFLAGMNQLEEAEKELASAGAIPELAKEISTLKSEIERRKRTGQYTFLYDRENLPIVSRSFNGTFKILYEIVRPLLQNPSGDYLAKLNDRPNRQTTTTLLYRFQSAALAALKPYAGAIVLLDVQNGDILAAASSVKGHNSSHAAGSAIATHKQYEPGSIIKMITAAGAMERGSHPEKLFPMNCDGVMKLSNNQVFYDWKPHNHMQDINVASALSCNVGFAKIGLNMKPGDLIANLRTFGFDERMQNSYMPFELGKIIKKQVDDLYLVNLSIGLDYLKMTPLHAAMVASAIANQGLAITPRLFLHHRNIIGVPYSASKTVPFRSFMSKQTATTLTKAMESVVLHPEGTGRRAAITNLPIAVKTGTAGDGAKGYDAIIIGFAPVKNPKVAFAVVAEHSGKAEFEGARITKLFLESIQGYIH